MKWPNGGRESHVSRSEVPGAASPGSLLEMQILGPHTRPAESGSWGAGPRSVLTCPPGESHAPPDSRTREVFAGELSAQSLPARPLPQAPASVLGQAPSTAVTSPSHTLPPLPSSHSGPKTRTSLSLFTVLLQLLLGAFSHFFHLLI